MKEVKGTGARGLATVLLSIIVAAFNTIPVQASTVDDLRAYLGIAVEKKQPTMIEVSNNTNGQLTSEDSTSNKNFSTTKLEQLKLDLVKIEARYEQGLKNGTPAVQLLLYMSSIKDTKEQIRGQEKLNQTTSNIDVNALIQNSEATLNKAEQQGTFGTYQFSIGNVGNTDVSPANNTLSLVTPYGYTIDSKGNHNTKNSSIELRIALGKNILSEWNGKIAYIEDDDTGNYKVVTIYHGQGLYTVYHHIIPGEIFVGKPVNQGDTIGTAGNTKSTEQNKENHLKFEVILDGKYINPILIFGNRSEAMYNDWLKTHYETNTVEVGEEFYYSSSMSKDNPNNSTNQQNTIKGAAEVDRNYALPDPGVAK